MMILGSCSLADPARLHHCRPIQSEGYGVPHAPLETIDDHRWCGPGDRKAKTRDLARVARKDDWSRVWLGQEMHHHQSRCQKPHGAAKIVWCTFAVLRPVQLGRTANEFREEREGRSREERSYFRAMINNVKTGLLHLGREDLEQGTRLVRGWNDYCQWPVEEAGQRGRGIIERYSHNLKHMLVDLARSIGRPTLPIVIGELGVHGTEVPKSRSGWALRAFRPPAETGQLDHCCLANRSILGCPRHRSLGVPLQRFRRKLSAYGTHLSLHLLALDALLKGQVMIGGPRRHANHVASLSTRCWRLGLESIFRLWRASIPTSPNTTSPTWRSAAAEVVAALHYANETLFPLQPSTILYYCGSNDVNAGEDAAGIAERFRLFSELTRDRLPDTDIFFGAINRSPEKKERWAVVDEANQRVASYCETQDGRTFVNLNQVHEADDGSTRQDMFLPDQLHLTEKAYEGFARVMREALDQQVQTP